MQSQAVWGQNFPAAVQSHFAHDHETVFGNRLANRCICPVWLKHFQYLAQCAVYCSGLAAGCLAGVPQ